MLSVISILDETPGIFPGRVDYQAVMEDLQSLLVDSKAESTTWHERFA